MKVGSGEQHCLGARVDVTGTCGCGPSVWVPVTWGRLCFLGTVHPHFADEHTEAQRGEGTGPRPQGSKRQSRICTLSAVTLILSVSPQEFQVFKFPLYSCRSGFFWPCCSACRIFSSLTGDQILALSSESTEF